MSYAADHASAFADVSSAGAPVTWALTTPGTYTAATDSYGTPSTASCPGVAIEVDGDDREYRDLELIALNPATLFFVPTTLGDKPALGALGSWGGSTRVVKRIRPIAPDGTAIAMYLVVA